MTDLPDVIFDNGDVVFHSGQAVLLLIRPLIVLFSMAILLSIEFYVRVWYNKKA